MSNDQQQDRLAQNRAVGIVNALVDQDETGCSDCGERIDVSDADTTGAVVEKLEQHCQQCSGEWYE